jgi:hypothetical protein
MTNVGRWDAWDAGAEPVPYADTVTYQMAADWLEPCETVEDWGCGRKWFSTFRPNGYIGLDGSGTYADRIVDLATYRSTVEGILLRHVIEHDYRWADILDNAVASFTRRMCLIVFTPVATKTHEIAFTESLGVPDIVFARRALTTRFDGCEWTAERVQTQSQYGVETVFRVERP